MNRLTEGQVVIKTSVHKETKPYGRMGCAECLKHKPLFYIGYEGEQWWLCNGCLRKYIKKYDAKGRGDEHGNT